MYSNNYHHHHHDSHHHGTQEHHYCSICGQPLHETMHSAGHERIDQAGFSTSLVLFMGLVLLGLLVFRTNVFTPPTFNEASTAIETPQNVK
jgi:ABC-type nickel/cobalt efflux system permease component RcnA